jgi:hypothetical protein
MKQLLISVVLGSFVVGFAFGQGEAKSSSSSSKAAAQQECCETEKAHATKSAAAQEECCKSTEAKPIAKGEPGCCNAKGEVAKFKVFVAGTGYKFFGCKDSASKAREELVAKGLKVGLVQKVTGKARIA